MAGQEKEGKSSGLSCQLCSVLSVFSGMTYGNLVFICLFALFVWTIAELHSVCQRDLYNSLVHRPAVEEDGIKLSQGGEQIALPAGGCQSILKGMNS